MKLTFFITLILCSQFAIGQIYLTKIDSAKLPKQIKYVGHLNNAVKYSDSLGINYILTTTTDESSHKNSKSIYDADWYSSKALYAYHYVIKGDSTKLLWRIYDFNKECMEDIVLYFINGTFKITDLNKNGIAEVWIMYDNGCMGGVSPAPRKLIMYEGTKKYAARGKVKLNIQRKIFWAGNTF